MGKKTKGLEQNLHFLFSMHGKTALRILIIRKADAIEKLPRIPGLST